MSNVETARNCLRSIRDIAERGAASWDPADVGYALQELSQVLLERAGIGNREFETVPADQIPDLEKLRAELELVDCFSQDMCRGKICN